MLGRRAAGQRVRAAGRAALQFNFTQILRLSRVLFNFFIKLFFVSVSAEIPSTSTKIN